MKNYIWFIKESQKFMKGTMSKSKIFILSLYKGIGFCREMKRWERG